MATEYEEDFFRKTYDSEIEGMHKLDSTVTFPAAIITILGGWMVYYAQNFPPPSWHLCFVIFAPCLLGAAVSWVLAIPLPVRIDTAPGTSV